MSSLSIIHCIHMHGDARRQKRGDKDRYGASSSGLVGGLSSLSPSHTPSLSLSSCLLHFHVRRDDVASRIKWLKIKLQLSRRGTWASDECGWIKWLATRHLSRVCFIESEFFCLRRVQLDAPLLYVGLFCFRQSYFIPQKRCEEPDQFHVLRWRAPFNRFTSPFLCFVAADSTCCHQKLGASLRTLGVSLNTLMRKCFHDGAW